MFLSLLVISIGVWVLLPNKLKIRSSKETTPQPKRFNPNDTEHYTYPTVCETEEGVLNVCNNLIYDGYINFTVYHRVNKVLSIRDKIYGRVRVNTTINSVHIYIPNQIT